MPAVDYAEAISWFCIVPMRCETVWLVGAFLDPGFWCMHMSISSCIQS